MVVCKYFLQGNCRFGDRCKNEHPSSQNMQGNRFAPLQNPGGFRGRSGAISGPVEKSEQEQLKDRDYNVTTESIAADLKVGGGGDRPIWPFSAYAPGKWGPRQLLEGPVEQSMEEMRVQYYLAQATGQSQDYVNKEQALLAQVDQQVQAIKNDLEGARRYVLEGEHQHPNRFDELKHSTQDFPRSHSTAPAQQQQGGGFGQSSFGAAGGATGGGAFGAPSQLGAPKPAFGAPSSMGQPSAFGAPSQPGASSGFGRPSSLGTSAGFGAPSNSGQNNPFGGARPSAFGAPSQLGQAQPGGSFAKPAAPAFGSSGFGTAAAKPAFGAPSLGQPSQQSAFGAPSQPGQSAFGAPSQPGQSASPFGQVSQPGQAAPGFGQASQMGASSSPFGGQQTQQQGQQAGGSAFGAPSAFGAAANKPSPFAAAAQAQQTSSSPFASTANNPSPFAAAGQTQPSTSAFGAPSQQQEQPNPGPFASSNPQQPTTSPFGQPSNNAAPSPFAAAAAAAQPTSTAPATNSAGGKPVPPPTTFTATTWRGKPIVRDPKTSLPCVASPAPTQHDPRRQRLDRVWFPDGPPPTEGLLNPTALQDSAGPAEMYEGPLGQTLRELYEFAMREGTFKDGVMPEVPPKHEWIRWDL